LNYFQLLRRLFWAAWLIRKIDMSWGNFIKKGNTAEIYLHDGKIIKIFNDNLPDTEAEHEAYKQRYAYSCGLPVPYVYDVTKINGKQVIIMEYITGKTIGELIRDDITKAEKYMSLSVDVQIKIHRVKANDFTLMTDKLSRQIHSARLISEKQKSTLLDKMYNFKYDNFLCHGDYHIENLILGNGDTTIIDWVDASAGDIRADVCRSYILYSQFSKDLAELYLHLYCEKSGIYKDEILMWDSIIAGARLSENMSDEKAGYLISVVELYCPY